MKPFSLLVKPASADCNLRCDYCFYLDKCSLYPDEKKHRMSDAVLDRMIASYMATDQPVYAFGWQGGEPTLMGVDFFKRVTELQQKHGRSGTSVSNGLQTNCTMITDDLAQHLARYNFLVGVSLDGPAEVHDHWRTCVNGRGSHADVMDGIEVLKRNNVEFNILTLVNSENVRKPREIYRYLRDHGFLFHQYIECVEFDENGRTMPFAISGEEWGDFLCGIYDEWIQSDTRKVSIRLFDSILAMMVDGVANVCKMGKDCRQYFLVEYNGDIYPCDFFVEPDLRLGNLADGSWEDFLAADVYRAFGEHKAAWNRACDACEYLRYCAGDCQKNRFYRVPDPAQLSALCTGWKRFYKHSIEGFKELAGQVRKERTAQVGPVGRNDPCPCGSGRKHKRCCGR